MAVRRHLDWDGMGNVRDLGGLPTATGERIRTGALVRSESLHLLHPTGWAALRAHGVRTTIDLRSEFERKGASYGAAATAAGQTVRTTQWEEGLLDDPEFRSWAQTGQLGTALYYARFLERWPERTARTVRAVSAARQGGVLIHCVRGRDRTGLLTLLLLALAEVPNEEIVADYLLTDERSPGGGAVRDERLRQETALYAEADTTVKATLDHLLVELDVNAYLTDAGITSTELDRIRRRLVETV